FMLLAIVAPQPACAVPDLQLFVEGATYDPQTETWVTASSTFNLQVLVANNTLEDVFVAVAIPPDGDPAGGTVMLGGSPVTIGSSPGTPTMNNGHSLPGHGIYPTYFGTYFLGDLVPTAATPVQDMQPGGGGGWSTLGLVVTIPVTITGFASVHFDVYDHIVGETKVRFAPFSHDAEYTPEPGSLVLLLSGTGGVLGLGVCKRVVSRRRRGSAA
ncbi:MAG: choice-of-anchor N protein, partial [Armatimonadetes bacterium]|nr:choice-of-anchor N protein [Armatimonadota bacterium]